MGANKDYDIAVAQYEDIHRGYRVPIMSSEDWEACGMRIERILPTDGEAIRIFTASTSSADDESIPKNFKRRVL